MSVEILKSLMHLNSGFMCSCYYRNSILYDIKRNPNCFYHQPNYFPSGLILYISKEAFHGVISLLRSKIVKLYTLFSISNTFISNARLKSAKDEANAKQQPEANFLLFGNYSHSSSTLSLKNNMTHPKK